MVAHQHHERVVGEPEVRQAVEEAPQPHVHERDLGGVQLAHPAQQPAGEVDVTGARAGRGERLDRLQAAADAVAAPYMSISRRGASQGSWASKESTTSANGCGRVRAHSIQPIASRNTFAAL